MKIHYFCIKDAWPISNEAVVVEDGVSAQEAFEMCYPKGNIDKYDHEEYEVKPGLTFSGFGADYCGIDFEVEPEEEEEDAN